MFQLSQKTPRQVVIGWSGGVDSMAAVDFLSRSHNLTVVHINHGTPHSNLVSSKASELLSKYDVEFIEHHINPVIPTGRSSEDYWREERYKIFHSYDDNVITCHHLDDCIETWVWSSMHGQGKIIPYSNGNVIRPFRLNPKNTFINWAKRNRLQWVEDNSNSDTKYTRNYIRHEMMPHVLRVNPGIAKVIRKKIIKEDNNDRRI